MICRDQNRCGRESVQALSRRRFAKAAVAALGVAWFAGASLSGALARHSDGWDDGVFAASGGSGGFDASGGSGGSGGSGWDDDWVFPASGGSGGSGGSGWDDDDWDDD